MNFNDHFSSSADTYRRFRPRYPVALFKHLASLCRDRNLAWDCATGSGQAAISLAPLFREVIATDASRTQIAQAPQDSDNLTYVVARVERSGLDADSVDLITVAQALHWFDIDTFSREADRVLAHQGIVGVWTYNLLSISDAIDKSVHLLYGELLQGYWPPERKMVEESYAGVDLPFTEIRCPTFEMSCEWRLADLIGYLKTWSAVRAYGSDRGSDPVDLVQNDLARAWGDAEQLRMVRWPLTTRAWRKD